MPTDKAHEILDIFAYFDAEPNHALLANHFLAVGGRRGLSADELQEGIEDAHRKGWIAPAERGWELTHDGFAESAKMSNA